MRQQLIERHGLGINARAEGDLQHAADRAQCEVQQVGLGDSRVRDALEQTAGKVHLLEV